MASERLLHTRGSMLSLALPVLARAASNAARSTTHQGGTPTDPGAPASSISTDPPKFSSYVNSTIDETPPPTGRSHHERADAHDLYQSSPRAELDQDPASEDLGDHITVCRMCAHASTFILPPAESIETTAETTSSPVSSTAPVSRTSTAVSGSVLTVTSDPGPVSFSSLGGTRRRGPSLSLPTVFGPTRVPGPPSRPISMSSARSNFPPTSLSNSYSSTTFGPGPGPASSSAGQPATTTVILTSPGSSIVHSGPSRSLVGALAASLGALLLVALLLLWGLLRLRRRRRLSSSLAIAHVDPPLATRLPVQEEEATPDEGGKEDGEEGCALHAPPLEAATASPGDAHPAPLPPHADPAPSDPSTTQPAVPPAPPTQSTRQDAILSTHRGAAAFVDILEPLPTAAPPMLPVAEHVEDEKEPPSSRHAAAANDQGDAGPEQHSELQDAPSSAMQGAYRAFEARARREGLGLGFSLRSFDREFAEDEDPPPYEPRAREP